MIHECGNKNVLATQLATHMNIQCVSVAKLAGMLGISSGYLSQLLSGDKSFASARDDVLRSAASVLGLPPVIAFLLAGRLRHEDFVEPCVSLQAELSVAMRDLSDSPYGLEVAVAKDDLVALPIQVQHLLAIIFGELSGRRYVSTKKRWPWLADSPPPTLAQQLRQK